ncbi:MAG: aldose 1-epimerase [Pseudonocardiales bacterium]|jgi:aldose 1-epimerase|nr:aldose 1-epimerase [Pseudonocardiales bacterium]
MTLTGEQYRIIAGDHDATIVEVGAGLRRYTHRGRDVTFGYHENELTPKGCGAVLVPWPNRIRAGRYTFDGADYQLALTEVARGNASHGLARWARWLAVRHTTDSVTLGLDVVPQPGWPFELRVEVTYALDARTGLSVSTVARNTGMRRLPFGIGFHPYVAIGHEPLSAVSVRLAAAERLVTDDASIPVGKRAVAATPYDLSGGGRLGRLRLDDAFTGLARDGGRTNVVVRAGRGTGARLWLDERFGYVQVFTAEVLAHGAGGVAVEPMTCPADAFNSGDGLLVLEPDARWSGTWGIAPL